MKNKLLSRRRRQSIASRVCWYGAHRCTHLLGGADSPSFHEFAGTAVHTGVLDISSHGDYRCSWSCRYDACSCILGKCRCRNSYLPCNCCKRSCCLVVGVVSSLSSCISVVCHGNVAENWIEGFCDDHVIPSDCFRVSIVINDKCVCQLTVCRNNTWADGLCDGEIR